MPNDPTPRELVLRLLDATRGYEGAIVSRDQGYVPLVAAALVARARHLATVTVRLADEGEKTETQILLRVLLEYAVTLAWLDHDRERNSRHWIVADIARRLAADDELRKIEDAPLLTDENRARYENLDELLRHELGGNPGQLPNVQQQARAIGFDLGYRSPTGTTRRAAFIRVCWRPSRWFALSPRRKPTSFFPSRRPLWLPIHIPPPRCFSCSLWNAGAN
jgi:hypothetical protein